MKIIITKKFTLLILFVLLATIARAHTGSFRGVIYNDNSKKPLEGVSICIKAINISAVTDAFGSFFLKGIEPGKYHIAISFLGYQTIEDEIKIEEGVTTEYSLNLMPADVKMSEVTVNAKKDLNLTSISGLDLKLRPVNSTQDLLRLVPGLFTAQHQGGGKAEQIFLRGFDADHGTDVNISVDGMPVNMVSHAHGQGFADTHFIIPETVQEMDYGKGPYQIDKGDFATAGWVGFKLKNSLDNSFVKVEGGSFDYFRTVVGINLLDRKSGNNNQEAYIAGDYGYFRGPFDISENFNRFNLMGKYTNYLSSNKILSLTLSGFQSNWDASGQIPTRAIKEGIVDRFGDLDPEGGVTSRYNMNLQYFQSINEHSYFKSNIYLTYYQFKLYSDFTFFLVDSINGDQIRQAEKRAMGGYNSEYSTSYTFQGLSMKTQFGLGFRYDDIMNDELSHTIDRSITLNPIALGDIHETNIYGYFNQTIYLLPQLVLTAGTRYDQLIQNYHNKLPNDVSDTTFYPHAFSPKAGIYYNFGNNARVYYNFGAGFHSNDTRTEALARQSYTPISGGAQPVQYVLPLAFSHDLGVIIKPYNKLLMQAALWMLDLQQEFTYDGDEDNVSPSGKTHREGIDFSVRYEILKWLYVDADFNYSHARYVDSAPGHNYLPLSTPFTSIGGVTFKISNSLSAGIRYRHMSDRPATSDNSIIAPGYTVCDAVINYIRPRYEFGLQMQNLFNVQWDEAAFATETRLRNEAAMNLPPQTDLCFTPGTPFFIKVSATYKF
ncbi:MAG TPA: TonB-dependent receptor [Flavipsychrobacter sp.]|nr:TonB-dependent receptor [Flavipsychrobacter sp.]